MKILLSICCLARRTGAELFVRDLALAFGARGHRVVVYAPVMGGMADELRRRSIALVTDPDAIAEPPEIVIGSTRHETVACLARFPGVPAISICHDRLAPHGMPPLFSRVRRHVAVDDNCLERLVLENGIAGDAVTVIRNGVDLDRFLPRAPLPDRPARAAIFSNDATRGCDTEAVTAACAGLGIAVDVVGSAAGTQAAEPASVLPGYDVVFAKARCAMEAMAVGCAVVLLNEGMGMAGLVTPANVEAWHRLNFGRRLLAKPIGTGAVRDALDGYSAAGAAAVSGYIRANASLAVTVAAFLRLAGEVVAEEAARPAVGPAEEHREFARYVRDAARLAETDRLPLQVGMLLAELEQERRLRASDAGHARDARDALREELRLRSSEAERALGACAALRDEVRRQEERWTLVQRSVSWRVTAPLRWAHGLVRGRA